MICFFLSHQLPMRMGFAVLRRWRPIAIIGNSVVVTKAADVREVLQRFDDFTLNEILREGMPWGPFLMTVDWREQHDQERRLLQGVVMPRADTQRVREMAAEVCAQRIAALSRGSPHASRRIDVVSDLAVPAMERVVQDYIGVPALPAAGPNLARVMADLASLIMVKPPAGSERWEKMRASIIAITTHLNCVTQARQHTFATAPTLPLPWPGDLLGRLMHRLGGDGALPVWFDRPWIRRYVTGLVGTGGFTIVRATTHAVDRLMAHPRALKRARGIGAELDAAQAALSGLSPQDQLAAQHRIEVSRGRLQQIVYEALRFRPMLPLLVRYCPRETIIAKGMPHARMAPAGASVLAPPLAAMFDPQAIEMPSRFCSSRPLEDYLHFGHGDRTCFGRYIADAAMIEIVRALLRLDDLKRASGSDGRIRYDGPVAEALVLTFR